MATIEQRIKKLERTSSVPGTILSRVWLDAELLPRFHLAFPRTEKLRERYLVWCLALGNVYAPKAMFYGMTILEALKRAEAALL